MSEGIDRLLELLELENKGPDRFSAATPACRRTFAAQPAGFVRLELQVEHHVEQDRYLLDALFSWDAQP